MQITAFELVRFSTYQFSRLGIRQNVRKCHQISWGLFGIYKSNHLFPLNCYQDENDIKVSRNDSQKLSVRIAGNISSLRVSFYTEDKITSYIYPSLQKKNPFKNNFLKQISTTTLRAICRILTKLDFQAIKVNSI